MLRRVRRQLLHLLRRSGVYQLAANSSWRRRRLLILCYHGVSIADEHEWNNQLYVSPAMLRERFQTIVRAGCHVLPLDEALVRLREGTLPALSVALTFDDGGHDFHARAFPLLREFGFPATVYLTTYYCHFQRPVFDVACAYLLWRARRDSFDFERLMPGVGRLALDTAQHRRAAARRIRDWANDSGLSGVGKDETLHDIARALGLDYDAIFSTRLLSVMTPDEVREVAAAGIDVQLHTHRHRTPADRESFRQEIEDNRLGIEGILGPGARDHFCYPSGVYRPAFVGWLGQCGVRSATTCDPGLAAPDADQLLLPRLVDTGNISQVEFEGWLTGVGEWVPHRKYAEGAGSTLADRRARAKVEVRPARRQTA